MDSNPDSDHLSHVDCDPDWNPDSGPGARHGRFQRGIDLKFNFSNLTSGVA